MEKRFKLTGWSQRGFTDGLATTYWTEYDPGWALGTYALSGERRSFAVNPKTDLFCLRPFNPDSISWNGFTDRLPIFRIRIGHLAMEYDPFLGIRMRGLSSHPQDGILRYVHDAATYMQCVASKLWFIDNRLRRRPGACHVEGYR